jgi:RNA polymerase sigma-70 factor (ECF subfamily)
VRAAEASGGLFPRYVQVNGQPGAMVYDDAGRLIGVLVFDVADGQIQTLRAIVNPDKLRHLRHISS